MPFKADANDFLPDAPAAASAMPVPKGIRAQPGDFIDEGPVADSESPGVLEAGLRGFGQGATLNFSDELVGLGKALFENIGGDSYSFAGKYKRARDEEREKNRKAREAHGLAYGAGDIAGSVATSFVPGLGIAKGAGVAKTALGAAKLGAVAGFGGSEKEDLGGQLADAAASGALSGATAGLVSKFVAGAPKRVVDRTLGDITDGATATMRDKVVGKAGNRVDEALSVMREKPFKQAGRSTEKLLEQTNAALQDTGKRLDAAIGKGAQIKVSNVLGAVEDVAKRLEADPGKASLARAVRSTADDVLESWGNKTHVSAQDVRVLASDIADSAFSGSPAVAPKAGKSVSREVWSSLKGLIDDSVNEARPGGSVELKALNQRMSTLMNMREALTYRATREATKSTRLRDVMGGAMDLGLIATSPTAFVGKKAIEHVGAPVGRKLDDALAQVVTWSNEGVKPAIVVRRLVEMGLSPVVAQTLASWGGDKIQEIAGDEAQ